MNIKDNPSVSKMLNVYKFARPFAKLLIIVNKIGIGNKKLTDAANSFLSEYDNIYKLYLPDKFNKNFSVRGWIAYESMDMDIMEDAVNLAENDRINDAEELLVEYYNAEKIEYFFFRFEHNVAFKDRVELLRKYLTDFKEGRYHSCIPGVLMMLDGIAADLGQPGLFGEKASFETYDSIVGHKSGLEKLSKVFGCRRTKTTDDVITIPYRHGILHGHDLGFDNKFVAAKCWAALIALSDWSVHKDKKPEEEKKVNFVETVKKISELKRIRRLLEEWKPRRIKIGNEVPARGALDDYIEGTPERSLVEFIEYWQRGNYGKFVETLKDLDESSTNRKAGKYRKELKGIELLEWKLLNIRDEAVAITEIEVLLLLSINGQETSKEVTFRLIYEDESGNPLVRLLPEGKWKIITNIYNIVTVNGL